MDEPEIVIAHDYLTQRGGAERVVLALHRMYPDAPIHTTLYDPDGTFPEFRRPLSSPAPSTGSVPSAETTARPCRCCRWRPRP